jgi:hypothetical protein
MSMKHTTRKQDAAFLMARMADATKGWKVGDTCLSYNMRETTTVASIDGDIVTLANGDSMHVSKMRSSR